MTLLMTFIPWCSRGSHMGSVMAKFATTYILSQIAAAHMALHHRAQKCELELLASALHNSSFQKDSNRVKSFAGNKMLKTPEVTPEIKMAVAKKCCRNATEVVVAKRPTKKQCRFKPDLP